MTIALLLAGLGLEASAGPERIANPFLPVIVLGTLVASILGHAVAARRPGHPVGRILQADGACGAVVVLAGGHASAALADALPPTGATATLWLSRWLWVLLSGLQAVALPFAFPDGRLPSPGWRLPRRFALGAVLAFAVANMVTPFSQSVWRDVPVTNPVAVPGPWSGVAWLLGAALFVTASAVAAGALVAKLRRATGEVRQRLRWVTAVGVLVPVSLALSLLAPGGEVGGLAEMVVGTLFAGTLVVATLRHRMYDADVALNRAVVYGLLLTSLLGAYLLVVIVLGRVVGGQSWLPAAAGAGVVAVAFSPLLHWLRRSVRGLLLGAPGDQTALVEGLTVAGSTGAATSTEEVLGRCAEVVRESLRLPWVRLQAFDLEVERGESRTAGTAVRLQRGDRALGVLTVGDRFDGYRPTSEERDVLRTAAQQLGLTLEALALAAQLRAARDQVQQVRDSERRRIRNDLHDVLGPVLAGVALGLAGAEEIGRRDPAAAMGVLPRLHEYTRDAVAEVRRLVEGLGPAELDTFGLRESLRRSLTRRDPAGSESLSLRPGAPLPPLPRVVEVAALRIATEAATNAARHAPDATCTVAVEVHDRHLVVEVHDDGPGMADDVEPHVGLASMRERAERIGGSLNIESGPDVGTRILARLPVELQ
ncbi:MAG: sensor histidine kinase [Ornithinimicrobium sp.]|uniref:sensor histidine kinase n=1 Tax=Ornithinimicrobium sp. TaxID=1977084 RepID=UPI003D9B8BF8